MRFFTTAVEKAHIRQRILDEPGLYKALRHIKEGPADIDEYAQKQLELRQDDFLTMQVLGPQGIGKSGVGQYFAARYAQVRFTADHISLHYDGFLDLVATIKRGEFIILDEQTKLHGIGSRRLPDDIVNIVETLRKQGGSMIFISPTQKVLNETDVHLTIEVLGRENDVVLCAYKHRGEEYLGAFTLRLEMNNPIWLAYEEKKFSYLEDAKKLRFQKNNYEALADELAEHPDIAHGDKKDALLLILEKIHPNLTTQEKSMIIAEYKLRKKKTV